MIVWVLKDDRPGNYSQAINLADSLDIPYEVKEISYNRMAKLPNFLKFGAFSTITLESRTNLLNQKNRPDVVICAGRRSALVALDLKKSYPNVFLINIMNPGSQIIKRFDLAIVPKHDKIKGNNIINISGSVAGLSPDAIKKTTEEFFHIFKKIKSPKIALLVGGSSKNAKFKQADGIRLRKITDRICKNMKANLIVTTSRRTDQFIIDELQKRNSNIKYFFKWEEGKKNPYLAILNEADFIIATGDSISMCCEASSFGKPFYIYANSNFCSKKHLQCHENLFKEGFALPLSEDLRVLEKKKSKKFDEIKDIAKKIKKILKQIDL